MISWITILDIAENEVLVQRSWSSEDVANSFRRTISNFANRLHTEVDFQTIGQTTIVYKIGNGVLYCVAGNQIDETLELMETLDILAQVCGHITGTRSYNVSKELIKSNQGKIAVCIDEMVFEGIPDISEPDCVVSRAKLKQIKVSK